MDKNFPRLLDTLKLIPQKRYTSADAIQRNLEALGHAVSKRTVERDLVALSTRYDIECDRRFVPHGWRWHKRAQIPVVPALDLQQALGFALMERELADSLPPVIREALRPWFEEGRRKLQSRSHTAAARWSEKIAFRSLGPPLLPAKALPGVLDTVNEALFTERPVDAEYRSAHQPSFRAVRLHPLGLIQTELITYLVACFDGYSDPRLLALHRLRRVRLLPQEKLTVPAGFNLKRYLDNGALGFGSNGPVKLRLLMTKQAAAHLYDTPLSRDQAIVPQSDAQHVIVEATVDDTSRLEWWINGFGVNARRI